MKFSTLILSAPDWSQTRRKQSGHRNQFPKLLWGPSSVTTYCDHSQTAVWSKIRAHAERPGCRRAAHANCVGFPWRYELHRARRVARPVHAGCKRYVERNPVEIIAKT